MKTLKQFITEFNEEEGYSTDMYELFETFEECFDVVHKEVDSEHRWYNSVTKVVKVTIDGAVRFFEYPSIEVKGENLDRCDCGFETPDLDDLKEVFPVEKTITVYE